MNALMRHKPRPRGAYHRFGAEFWRRAGFSQQALPVNRLARLAEDQDVMFGGDAFRLAAYCLVATGGCVGIVALLFNHSTFSWPDLLKCLGALSVVTGIFAAFAVNIVRARNEDLSSRSVESFCGELTRWVVDNYEGLTDDSRGLQHGDHRVNTTLNAWYALPPNGHYRIYFTPRQRNVVNVEEHSDDAPHNWPR